MQHDIAHVCDTSDYENIARFSGASRNKTDDRENVCNEYIDWEPIVYKAIRQTIEVITGSTLHHWGQIKGAMMQHQQPNSSNEPGINSAKYDTVRIVGQSLIVAGAVASLAPQFALAILSVAIMCVLSFLVLIGSWSVIGLGAFILSKALNLGKLPAPSSTNQADSNPKQASDGKIFVWLVLGSVLFFGLLHLGPTIGSWLPGSSTLGNPSGSSVYSRPSSGAVWVNSYYRSDGTSVSGHYRSSPDGDPSNNWSNSPNVNPYTGKLGTHFPKNGR